MGLLVKHFCGEGFSALYLESNKGNLYCGLLYCHSTLCGQLLPMLWRNMIPPSCVLKLEAVSFSMVSQCMATIRLLSAMKT